MTALSISKDGKRLFLAQGADRLYSTTYRISHYEFENGEYEPTQELDNKFADCSRNKLSPDQINEAIDQFHQSAEDPYKRYRSSDSISMVAAQAVATGVLDRTTIGPDVLAHLGRAISFFESQGSAQ